MNYIYILLLMYFIYRTGAALQNILSWYPLEFDFTALKALWCFRFSFLLLDRLSCFVAHAMPHVVYLLWERNVFVLSAKASSNTSSNVELRPKLSIPAILFWSNLLEILFWSLRAAVVVLFNCFIGALQIVHFQPLWNTLSRIIWWFQVMGNFGSLYSTNNFQEGV